MNDFVQAPQAAWNPSCAKPFPSGDHHATLVRGESTHFGHATETVSGGEVISVGVWLGLGLYGVPVRDSKLRIRSGEGSCGSRLFGSMSEATSVTGMDLLGLVSYHIRYSDWGLRRGLFLK